MGRSCGEQETAQSHTGLCLYFFTKDVEQLVILYFNTCTVHILLFFIITNKCTINIIKLYITTVALCNLYSYMFRHFHVIVREFKTNTFLSYISFFKIATLETHSL